VAPHDFAVFATAEFVDGLQIELAWCLLTGLDLLLQPVALGTRQ